MTPQSIVTQYSVLSAEERFRLILAASGRDDTAERAKLVSAASYINQRVSDHWPFAHAFLETATMAYLELLEDANRYQDLLMNSSLPVERSDQDDDQESWTREFDLVMVAGCLLRIKLKGWDRFCLKLHVPDRLTWMQFPGFERLARILETSKRVAFIPKGLLRWLNRQRQKGLPKLKRLPITAKMMAQDYENVYRERARFWGAQPPKRNKT